MNLPLATFKFVNIPFSLEEGQPSVVNITRVGNFSDPRYGRFSITEDMLLSMVANFEANTYGQDIFIDRAHKPDEGAAAKISKLWIDQGKLLAHVEWTPYGLELIHDRGYAYLSAEFVNNYTDNETEKDHGPLLRGAALTLRPVIKHQDRIQLSEATEPTYFDPSVNPQEPPTMDELKKKLRSRLEAIVTLSEVLIRQLVDAFGSAAVDLAEDQQNRLLESFFESGKTLAESLEAGTSTGEIKLSVSTAGLTEDQLDKILNERETKKLQESTQLSEKRDANVKLFEEKIGKAEGLDETIVTKLCEASSLITPEMTDAQITKLAENQIALGQEISVQAQLGARGYEFAGSTRIVHVNDQSIKRLEEVTDQRLGIKAQSDAIRYANTGGVLLAENKLLAEKALAKFDVENGQRLHQEAKLLAAGDGEVGDTAVPATFERFVIREALYGLVGLQFVNAGVAQFSSSQSIPYSYRDTTAAGIGNARTYQGAAISRAGVIQDSEDARPIPQKLAFSVTDELRYLTMAGQLDWDAVAENARNAVRIVQEDTEQLIFNEQVHAADEYLAATATAEDLELQADGVDKVFILANFPVVRPRMVFGLNGVQVGSTINPVTVTYNSVVRAEYDGTGTQAAGTYYVLDYNLGEIYLVDEVGAIQIPANTTAYTITYSYATNLAKFDSDLGSDKTDEHWDKLLYQYGLRKNEIETRAHKANFGSMSGALMTQIEQAKQFGANSKRPGTDLSADGNLGRVKDVANFKSYAPNLWMKDQRMIIGERGQTRFRLMKPWAMGELENQRDANGKFTGKKEAYGDQFIVLHTPTQLKRALTTVLVYSATARVARVAP